MRGDEHTPALRNCRNPLPDRLVEITEAGRVAFSSGPVVIGPVGIDFRQRCCHLGRQKAPQLCIEPDMGIRDFSAGREQTFGRKPVSDSYHADPIRKPFKQRREPPFQMEP